MVKTARFWVPPVVGLIAALMLAAAALSIDQALRWPSDPPPPLFSGSASTARSLLAAIAGAGTSLLTFVFTILTVVIQLATGQYSARALRTLYTDRPSHFTIGIFVATISYSLVVLLRVSDTSDPLGVTVLLAVVLAIASVVTFAIFAHHVAHLIRVGSLAATVAADTRRVIDRRLPHAVGRSGASSEEGPPDAESARSIRAFEAGVLVDVDEQALVRAGENADVTVEVAPAVGDFVVEGAIILRVWGSGTEEELRGFLRFDVERRLETDPRLGAEVARRYLPAGVVAGDQRSDDRCSSP